MQIDFHYFATYAAAYLAGYKHEEALDIAYSAFFVDQCTNTFLLKVKGPKIAATTQLQMELMDADTDIIGLQNITRIWSSFHFLPKDLYAKKEKGTKRYMKKYRLICGPNGELVKDTIELAKGSTLQAVGIAMHVLADTWAHMYFAGTPSLAINTVNDHFYEIMPDGTEEKIVFKHNPIAPDDVINKKYSASIYQSNENSIMNLGHGQAGHLPDFSYCVYKYLPAWNDYREVIKDNPSDYWKAFCQMVYALKYIRGDIDTFELDTYAYEDVRDYKEEIDAIFAVRRALDSEGWKEFDEKLSGKEVPEFDIGKYQEEYMNSDDKDNTFLGKFFAHAIKHKSMVTNRIYESGSMLAGYSVTPDRSKLASLMVKNVIKGGNDNDKNA